MSTRIPSRTPTFRAWLYYTVGNISYRLGFDALTDWCYRSYRAETGHDPEWGGKP